MTIIGKRKTIVITEINRTILSDLLIKIYDEEEPCRVVICSDGGCTYSASAIYSAIKNSHRNIITIASGICASSAFIILQAGERRFAYSGTTFLWHPTCIDMCNDIEKNLLSRMNNFHKEIKFGNNIIVDSMTTNQGKSRIRKANKNDEEYYFDTNEALDIGAIDEII